MIAPKSRAINRYSSYSQEELEKSIWLRREVTPKFKKVFKRIFSQRYVASEDVYGLMYLTYTFKLKLDKYISSHFSPPVYWYSRMG